MKLANNLNGLVWYHALSMDLLLETSFTALSYKECDLFFLRNITTIHTDASPEAQSRLFANMLLWSVRHEIYEMSQIWSENLFESFSGDRENSPNQTFTGLRVMEALVLQLVYAIEDRDSTLFVHFDDEIKKIEKQLKSATEISKYFKERFELHRLHFKVVKKFESKSLRKLERLEKMSVKNQNFNASNLIKHTKKLWKRELPDEIEHFWINHSPEVNSLYLNDFSLPERIFPFSLPLPKTVNF